MKILFFSDVHGSPESLARLWKQKDACKPEQLVLLGDALYHGPRNPLRPDYAPPKVVPALNAEKERIIEEARKKAVSEAHLQIEEATRRIREEKEKAIREVRSEIADLSIAIAEKVMKEKIGRDKEQQQMIDRLLDEVSFSKS